MAIEVDTFRTDDMSMITYLKVQGHRHKKIVWENNICFWILEMTDDVHRLTQAFINGEASVEPRVFSREFATTKREFYDSRKDQNLRDRSRH